MVKCILFDLDGTLFDRDAAVRQLVSEQYRSFADRLGHVSHDDYVRRVVKIDAHGYGDRRAKYERLCHELRLSDELGRALEQHFTARYHSFCRSFPEVLPTLRSLAERGLSIGVVTNGKVDVQDPVIEHLGLADLLDVVLVSEREGVRKPEGEIFWRALRRLNVEPAEAWFVGDHPTVDVAGAYTAGLTAVWRKTDYFPKPRVPCREIQTLADLVPLTWDLASGSCPSTSEGPGP